MDIGFEGGFLAHRKSIDAKKGWVDQPEGKDWVRVKNTRFVTVFANDILEEARKAWLSYMTPRGHREEVYHFGSIVDFVKKHKAGENIFPQDIDIVTGGFPCQDFSVAGKRLGFDSHKDHTGHLRSEDLPTEETRGKLYCWMKEVIEITQPKIFVAENVKGLVNLGDVKTIIQKDFALAGKDGYIVLTPRVLHAANYGVPESRERVIFIGIRKNALTQEALAALTCETIPAEYDPYPTPTHDYHNKQAGLMPTVVCGDIFAHLPEPADSDDLSHRYYSKAKFMGTHCQGQKEISLNAIGPTIRSEHHGNIEFRRLSPEHGGCGTENLPERRLSPRECALIQTFPPDYEFVRRNDGNRRKYAVSTSGAYKVIGNAVPPVLAYNIAMRLQELWPKYFGYD